MKTYNTYFTTSDTLKKYLHTNNIRDNKKLLIQIFTSLTNEQDIKTMLSKISSLLPSANIIGATSASEICNTNITDDKTVISITQFIDTLVTTTFVQECKDDFTTGKTIVQKLTQEDTKLIITFTNGLHCNAQEYLKGIHQTNKDITVAGGMASDTRNFKSTYVFTKDEISSQGAVGAGLHNQKLKIYTQAAFNWLSIGMEMIVTNADENRVFTIDNQSAYDIYTKYLGKDIAKKLPEAGLEYPLIIHKSNRKIARAVLVKHNDGSLTFGGNIKTGDIVTFGYGDSLDILEQSGIQFRKTLNEPIESIFIYSCIARYKFLQDAIIQEIEPLSMIAETAGFFTYGEFFSTKHSNELLNQTMTILAINESKPSTDKHITINTKKIKQTHQGRSVKALSNLLHNTIVALNKRYEILQSKEASLQLSQAIGHMGSWEVDFKSGLSFWSKEMYNIYGYEEQTYTPTLDNFIQRIIDTDKHKAKHLIQQLNDGKIHNAALHSTKSDGSIINILINGQILFNKKNEAEKIVGTTLDITELTQVKKTTKQQADIIEQLHDSVIVTDLDDIITYCNNSAALMHKYSKDEMIGHSIYMLYPESEIQKAYQMKQYAMTNLTHHDEIKQLTKQENTIYTEVVLLVLKDEQDSVTAMVRISKDITKREKIQEELRLKTKQLAFQAFHDDLTKLPNRALFYDRLIQSIAQVKRNKQLFALMFIDLDNFKQINDTLGHHIGDEVLKQTAKRLKVCIREQDTLSRLGGDEFTIILQNIKHIDAAAKIAEKIIKLIANKIIINDIPLYTSCSIGISLAPNDTINKDDLIKYADSAMYHAKSKGGNTYRFYSAD